MSDTLEVLEERIAVALERIADALEARGAAAPERDFDLPPPPKGICVLCDLPVKLDQASLPDPSGTPGIRHATAVDCLALQ